MDLIYKKIFYYSLYCSYILYILLIFGIGESSKYLNYLKTFLKIYIGILLLILGNPYNYKKTLSKFDKELIFNSGVFLLLSTSIIGLYEEKIKNESIAFIRKIII